jgi:hypothetical protein
MMWQPMVQPFGDENFYYRVCIVLALVAAEFLALMLWTMFKLGRANRRAKYAGRDHEQLIKELDATNARIAGLVPLPGGVMISAHFVDRPRYNLIRRERAYRQIRAELHRQIMDGGENALLISRVYLVDPQGRHIFGPPIDCARLDKGVDGRDLVKIVFRPCTFEQPFRAHRIVLATPDDGHAFEDQALAGDFNCGTGESLSIEITWTPETHKPELFEPHRAQDSTVGLPVSEVCKDEPADDPLREQLLGGPPPAPNSPGMFVMPPKQALQASTADSYRAPTGGRLGPYQDHERLSF